MVDDAKVQPGLAALVLCTDALQLVLPGGHLHQPGVGIAQNAVQIVHLDVGFQLDFLLAGQSAARRSSQCADPLPPAFQRLPRLGGSAVLGRCFAVGQQLCRKLLFPAAQGLPRGGQFGLLCGKLLGAAGGQFLLGGGLLCGQRLHSGLGGGNGLLGLFQLALRRVHTGAQGAAVGFQLVQCRLCVRAPGVGQGGAPLCDLTLQRVSTCILCGSAAVGLGSGLLQRRTLADLFLPVGFQLRLAAAVGLGLSALCFAVCLCRLQGGTLLGQNVGHQGKGEGDCALRGGKALRQQGLGVPPERSFRLIGSGKGALGGSAGVLRLPVSFRSGLPCGFHLCLCGRSVGQQGAGGVMSTAAHRAGCTLGQTLGQQPGLCVQECPFQRVPPGAGFVLRGGSGAVIFLRLVCGLGLSLAVRKALFQLCQRFAALCQLGAAILQREQPGVRVCQRGKFGLSGGKGGVQAVQLGAALLRLRRRQPGGVPRFGLLTAERVQRVIGRKGALRLGHLRGQGIQLCSVPGVAVGLGASSIQCGLCGGELCLTGSQLLRQLLRLCGSTQLLLYRVQLGFGGLQGGAGFFQRCRLPGSQGVQQGKRRFRYSLGAQGAQRLGIRVLRAELQPAQQAVQFGILSGTLLVQRGCFGL